MTPLHCEDCGKRFACDIDGKITLCLNCKAKNTCEEHVKTFEYRGMCYNCISKGANEEVHQPSV